MKIRGWYSTITEQFVLVTDDEPVVYVNSEQFLEKSDQVARDCLERKCVVSPFTCPNCAGWQAIYKAEPLCI